MELWQALIMGVVEGISEFLPISSTGHLMLTAQVLGLAPTEFIKSFEVAIQLGAILAVVVLYARSLLCNAEILKRVAAAFVPTAVVGLVLYKFIKKVLLGNTDIVLWALFGGGVFLILFEVLHQEDERSISKIEEMSYFRAMGIGLFQALSVIPGVSRAAATIVGGLLLGVSRRTIVEFSFLLAIPTMAAATGLDLLKSAGHFSAAEFQALGMGFLASFGVAVFSIKFLLQYIQRHTFLIFGVYRIVLAGVFWIFIK